MHNPHKPYTGRAVEIAGQPYRARVFRMDAVPSRDEPEAFYAEVDLAVPEMTVQGDIFETVNKAIANVVDIAEWELNHVEA